MKQSVDGSSPRGIAARGCFVSESAAGAPLLSDTDMTHPTLTHHGGATGVTGNCHRLQLAADRALLVDCGLFQGKDAEPIPPVGAGPACERAAGAAEVGAASRVGSRAGTLLQGAFPADGWPEASAQRCRSDPARERANARDGMVSAILRYHDIIRLKQPCKRGVPWPKSSSAILRMT